MVSNKELCKGFDMIRERGVFSATRDYKIYFDSVPDTLFVVDQEYRIIDANLMASRMLQLPVEQLCRKRLLDFLPPRFLLSAANAFQSIELERFFSGEFPLYNQEGNEILFQWHVRTENGNDFQIWSGRVIESSKYTYQELHEKLKQKELLLKETHHRLKNNLQIVASLINLQAQADGISMFDVLRESQNRIRTMALIQENLYKNDEPSIDLPTYLHQLAKNLCSSYGVKSDHVKIAVESSGPVSIHVDRATPCGLIANEVISNSLKYAFLPGTTGEIRILVTRCDDTIRVEISDTGRGLPAGVSAENSKTLGLRLVHMLVDQLEGKLTMENDNGASFRIEFRA
jgi:two-component sensor histidine kinase